MWNSNVYCFQKFQCLKKINKFFISWQERNRKQHLSDFNSSPLSYCHFWFCLQRPNLLWCKITLETWRGICSIPPESIPQKYSYQLFHKSYSDAKLPWRADVISSDFCTKLLLLPQDSRNSNVSKTRNPIMPQQSSSYLAVRIVLLKR